RHCAHRPRRACDWIIFCRSSGTVRGRLDGPKSMDFEAHRSNSAPTIHVLCRCLGVVARANEPRWAASRRMRMQTEEVATVSPGRMFATGLTHLLIGLVWSIGPIVRFAADAGDAGVDSRVVAVVVILWPLGIPILLRGVALLQQAMGERGHFRASAEGIE